MASTKLPPHPGGNPAVFDPRAGRAEYVHRPRPSLSRHRGLIQADPEKNLAMEQRWEYRVTELEALHDDALETALNELGDQGWELAHVGRYQSNRRQRCILKRRLETS
ncbi:hypothetical protein J5X84_21110 [Streptosporangiaceae bacterium NEAU-GS5]|nr:hypothetical protein [Streptosporangiaceae bacterium NEAU-GS5]